MDVTLEDLAAAITGGAIPAAQYRRFETRLRVMAQDSSRTPFFARLALAGVRLRQRDLPLAAQQFFSLAKLGLAPAPPASRDPIPNTTAAQADLPRAKGVGFRTQKELR